MSKANRRLFNEIPVKNTSQKTIDRLSQFIIDSTLDQWVVQFYKIHGLANDLLPVDLDKHEDNVAEKIAWDIACDQMGDSINIHEAAVLFSAIDKANVLDKLKETVSRGTDFIHDTIVADIQTALLKGQSPLGKSFFNNDFSLVHDHQKKAYFACDFNAIAALNCYVNSLDKNDKSDKLKAEAILAIEEGLVFDRPVIEQCVTDLFRDSDELIFGDNWNNPEFLTAANILKMPAFHAKIKMFYKKSLMDEVHAVLNELQETTSIKLGANYSETPKDTPIPYRDMIYLTFNESRQYEVWGFQFTNIDELKNKIGVMAANEIEEIEKCRGVAHSNPPERPFKADSSDLHEFEDGSEPTFSPS
ncbi:hypothetical protein Q9L42_020690 (plasmid) [Methylomarinum sp. Ch1-1]|uniref:Uncharacterized protein n=1 Tax=Methylomarinum roseum TaxID=3067653 RepID=A0AAU7P0K3_9GAMM